MRRVRPAFAFVAVVWRVMARDRTALFFMLVLPVAIIVIIGTTFGGQERAAVGLVQLDDGRLAGRFATALERADGVRVKAYTDIEVLRRAVRRQAVAAGVVVPAGTSSALRHGRPARLGFVADRTSQAALSARIAVSGIVDSIGTPVAAAQFVTANEGGDFDANLALATSAAGDDGPAVRVRDVGGARRGDLSRFSLTAPQNLVLFVFINAMASAVLIVVARREGILRRALATRTSVGVILACLGLGWLALALGQSAIILAVGALLFDVGWGDPLGAAVLVLAFALVGCGAGLLVGAIGRSEDRVGALTPVIGIVLGRSAAAWSRSRWSRRRWKRSRTPCRTTGRSAPGSRLVFDGDGLAAILPSLAALAAFAAVFLALATSLLRRQLTR
jgi:ABC-2 type transport system permease protein